MQEDGRRQLDMQSAETAALHQIDTLQRQVKQLEDSIATAQVWTGQTLGLTKQPQTLATQPLDAEAAHTEQLDFGRPLSGQFIGSYGSGTSSDEASQGDMEAACGSTGADGSVVITLSPATFAVKALESPVCAEHSKDKTLLDDTNGGPPVVSRRFATDAKDSGLEYNCYIECQSQNSSLSAEEGGERPLLEVLKKKD